MGTQPPPCGARQCAPRVDVRSCLQDLMFVCVCLHARARMARAHVRRRSSSSSSTCVKRKSEAMPSRRLKSLTRCNRSARRTERSPGSRASATEATCIVSVEPRTKSLCQASQRSCAARTRPRAKEGALRKPLRGLSLSYVAPEAATISSNGQHAPHRPGVLCKLHPLRPKSHNHKNAVIGMVEMRAPCVSRKFYPPTWLFAHELAEMYCLKRCALGKECPED